jgi:hypothetical protein
MARVKCVMMQRDEDALLDPWLRWYTALFGARNLLVLDNGSVLPAVRDRLAVAEAEGVAVVRGHDAPQDFLDKGLHVEAAIRRFDAAAAADPAANGYDFALPLDCDEFLAVWTADGLSCEPDAIHAALDGLRGVRSALGIEMSLFNAPNRPGWFVADTLEKGFLPANSVQDVDHGFHRPRSRLQDGTCWTRLCFLHFHNKPFDTLRAHARRKLDGLVDHGDPDALRRYAGINAHLVPYFFIRQDQYEGMPDHLLTVRLPSFARRAAVLELGSMLDWPARSIAAAATDGPILVRSPEGTVAPFDGAAYLAANPDVVRAGVMPLQHYLRHGWREGRPLPGAAPG